MRSDVVTFVGTLLFLSCLAVPAHAATGICVEMCSVNGLDGVTCTFTPTLLDWFSALVKA
jgi:hypothetical protein